MDVRTIKTFSSFILGKCRCGCNEDIPIIPYNGYLRRYQNHHNTKKGHESNLWNGGKFKTQDDDGDGYWMYLNKNHPNCTSLGYVMGHRLVYEHYLFILFDEEMFIPKEFDIHHINGNTEDNSLINLQLLTKKDHQNIHHMMDMTGRICSECGSMDTWISKNGRPFWRKNGMGGYWCSRCVKKILRMRKK